MLYSLPQERNTDTSYLETLLNKPQLTTIVSSVRSEFSMYMYIVHVECSPLPIITQIPFKVGDKAYFIPWGYEVDLTLLPKFGCWDTLNNCGSLKGPLHNVTHISAVNKQLSYGLLIKYDETNPLDLTLFKPYNPQIGEDFLMTMPNTLSLQFNKYLPQRKRVALRDEFVVLEKPQGISLYFYQLNGGFNVMNFGKTKNILISNPYLAAQGLVYKNIRADQSIVLSLVNKYQLDKIWDLIRSIKPASSIFIHANIIYSNNIEHKFSTCNMVINKIIVDGNSMKLPQEFRVCELCGIKHTPIIAESTIVTPKNSLVFMEGKPCLTKDRAICSQASTYRAGLYLRNLTYPTKDIVIDNPMHIINKKGVDLL